MNEEYLQRIFEAINGEDKGFDFNAFKRDMSTNSDYNRKVFEAIGGEGKGFRRGSEKNLSHLGRVGCSGIFA